MRTITLVIDDQTVELDGEFTPEQIHSLNQELDGRRKLDGSTIAVICRWHGHAHGFTARHSEPR